MDLLGRRLPMVRNSRAIPLPDTSSAPPFVSAFAEYAESVVMRSDVIGTPNHLGSGGVLIVLGQLLLEMIPLFLVILELALQLACE